MTWFRRCLAMLVALGDMMPVFVGSSNPIPNFASESITKISEECYKEAACLNGVHIGVIGAGPFGLSAAAIAKSRGYCVTIVEKQEDVGGDWRLWGNPWSKLQVHRDTYLFRAPNNIHVEGEDQLPVYPSREQMLMYFRKYAKQAGIYDNIIFNATVTGRSRAGLIYEKDNETKSIKTSHIFSAPGRLSIRSEVYFDSEDKFQGQLAWGIGQDLAGVDWHGKHVVIVGHGSFAIENARHALEGGASRVVMISRHVNLVWPRTMSYALDWIHRPGSIEPTEIPMEHLYKMYALAGYNLSETRKIASLPFQRIPPTSDVFFLAIAAGKLKVVHGEVANLQAHHVMTQNGDVFLADVFIKSIGFKRNTKFDAQLIKPGLSDIEEYFIDHFVDEHHKVYITSGTNQLTWEGYPLVWPPDLTAERFFLGVEGWPEKFRWELRNVEYQDPLAHKAFLHREWDDYCILWGVNISYPYTDADVKEIFMLP